MNDKLSENFFSYHRSIDIITLGTNLAKMFLLEFGWEEIAVSFFLLLFPANLPQAELQSEKKRIFPNRFQKLFFWRIGGKRETSKGKTSDSHF